MWLRWRWVVLWIVAGVVLAPARVAPVVGQQDSDFSSTHSNEPELKSVVIVVDATGSMMPLYAMVNREVRRAISDLGPRSSYTPRYQLTVICYSGFGVYEFIDDGAIAGPQAVTPRFRDKVNQWLLPANHRFPTGGGDADRPAEAIALGLSYEPDKLMLISDRFTGHGKYAVDLEALLTLIEQHNQQALTPTRIDTVQFVTQDPIQRAGGASALQRIAERTGGRYRFVSQRQLGLR